jgi:hypothetical protein
MLRNTINRPSDTKFDDLVAQITSHQVLLGVWVNYRGELNFTRVATGVWGACIFECVWMYIEIFEVLYSQ